MEEGGSRTSDATVEPSGGVVGLLQQGAHLLRKASLLLLLLLLLLSIIKYRYDGCVYPVVIILKHSYISVKCVCVCVFVFV